MDLCWLGVEYQSDAPRWVEDNSAPQVLRKTLILKNIQFRLIFHWCCFICWDTVWFEPWLGGHEIMGSALRLPSDKAEIYFGWKNSMMTRSAKCRLSVWNSRYGKSFLFLINNNNSSSGDAKPNITYVITRSPCTHMLWQQIPLTIWCHPHSQGAVGIMGALSRLTDVFYCLIPEVQRLNPKGRKGGLMDSCDSFDVWRFWSGRMLSTIFSEVCFLQLLSRSASLHSISISYTYSPRTHYTSPGLDTTLTLLHRYHETEPSAAPFHDWFSWPRPLIQGHTR